ncbi:MAG: hypothetical protein U0793_31645 [Gemmataceae bacterium]
MQSPFDRDWDRSAGVPEETPHPDWAVIEKALARPAPDRLLGTARVMFALVLLLTGLVLGAMYQSERDGAKIKQARDEAFQAGMMRCWK